MSLKDDLMADFKQALKSHDNVAKETISLARAAIKQVEVDKRIDLDDSDVIAILQKQVKMRKDALADFEKAGRTDLVDSYNAEIAVLNKYLPKQLSKDEIRAKVSELADKAGIEKTKQNMGKLMGMAMKEMKGLADGNSVREVVTEFLSE
ncbi:MAG: GatB/YqeY domain-containing protein [Eubacteriales bacterium]|nr:GatB/YqeY domain-containing protein [Eubacteriales bacterium]